MCLYGFSAPINEGSKLPVCFKGPEKGMIILMSKYAGILLLAFFIYFFLKVRPYYRKEETKLDNITLHHCLYKDPYRNPSYFLSSWHS